MRISGTEPSPVIISQTKQFKKLKSDAQTVPKQAKLNKAKGNGVINPQIYNFKQDFGSIGHQSIVRTTQKQ